MLYNGGIPTVYITTQPLAGDPGKVRSYVSIESLLMARLPLDHLPESSRLHKVIVSDLGGEGADFPHPFLVLSQSTDGTRRHSFELGIEFGGLQRRSDVVRIRAVVVGEIHLAVTLERTVDGGFGRVSRKLLIVGSKAITGRIGVGKHASLKH